MPDEWEPQKGRERIEFTARAGFRAALREVAEAEGLAPATLARLFVADGIAKLRKKHREANSPASDQVSTASA